MSSNNFCKTDFWNGQKPRKEQFSMFVAAAEICCKTSSSWWFICRFIGDCYCGRYFVCKTQTIYGWWLYYMWSNVIGPVLAHIHSKLNVRTVADVGTCWRSRSGRACIVPGVEVLEDWSRWEPMEGLAVDRPADGGPGAASPSATRPGLARRLQDPGRWVCLRAMNWIDSVPNGIGTARNRSVQGTCRTGICI